MKVKRKVKLVTIIAIFVMVFTMMPMASGAVYASDLEEEFFTIDGLSYHLDNGKVTLWRCNRELVGPVDIPKTVTYSGTSYTISGIDCDTFYQCTEVTSVSIPDSISTIESCTFMCCTSLQSVSFPDSLTEISDSAFSGCKSLKSIKLPSNLERLGIGAFEDCDLTSINLPDNLQQIGPVCFRGNQNLKSVTVPAFAKFGTDYYCFGYYMDEDENNILIPEFTMSGYTGSDAEKYAKANNIPFTSLGSIGDNSDASAIPAAKSVTAKLAAYNKIKISWEKVSGAKKYYVYQKAGSGKYKKVKTVTKTTCTASNLKGGTKYTYYVVAVDSKGKNGDKSKTVSVTTIGKPKNVKVVKKSNTSVTVKWSKAAGASGYQISMSTSAKKTKTKCFVDNASTLSKILSAKVGKTYYYKVRAYKTVGSKKVYGPWSAVKSYKIKKTKAKKTEKTKQNTEKQKTNTKSDWYSRMYQFVELDAYKNGASWGATKKPLISSYGCKGCRAYAADFVAYVYGKKNSKSDKKQNKYDSYVDCNGGYIEDITQIKAGDIVCDDPPGDDDHVFAVIDINWDTGEMYTAEGNVSGKLARVGNTYYRIAKDSNGKPHLEEKYGGKWEKRKFEFTRHYGNVD